MSTCRRTTCRASGSEPRRRSRTRVSGPQFAATVEASAQAVDVASGTTRMLLVVDNPKGELMTGAFATVRLELPIPEAANPVPASALIFDQKGLRVATVSAEDRIVLKQVTIARDLGREVEIGSGLTAQDRIVESPPDGVATATRCASPASPARGTPRRPRRSGSASFSSGLRATVPRGHRHLRSSPRRRGPMTTGRGNGARPVRAFCPRVWPAVRMVGPVFMGPRLRGDDKGNATPPAPCRRGRGRRRRRTRRRRCGCRARRRNSRSAASASPDSRAPSSRARPSAGCGW